MLLSAYLLQGHLLYHPTRTLDATPAAMQLDFDSVWFASADGTSIHGWYIPAPQATAVVLFLHGNAGNISHRLESIALFHSLKLSVFIFDYQGYGLSKGRPSESATYADALGAWTYLTQQRHINDARIVIFGRSLGGAIATWLASRQHPAGLFIESTFTSMRDIADLYYPFLLPALTLRFKYPVMDLLSKIDCPILIAHGPDDEVVPFEHGERLYARARAPKTFLRLRGGHNAPQTATGSVYAARLEEFIRGIVTVPENTK